MTATAEPGAKTNGHAPAAGTNGQHGANGLHEQNGSSRVAAPGRLTLPLVPPDLRRLGGEFEVKESARRVVRYQTATFHVMRLLGGWLAKIPEFELKFEIGRHVWQDAQAVEALRQRTSEL